MRNAKEGTYDGTTTFCPVFMYDDCPHCDQCNICHIEDPQKECNEWSFFWDSWEEWVSIWGVSES